MLLFWRAFLDWYPLQQELQTDDSPALISSVAQANQKPMQRAAASDREIFRYRGPYLSHDWLPDAPQSEQKA
ncbi:MAG TPA: hypothetical protein VK638_06230 [Edaphobacter sp.]|nr:hypothetical protein [Edaphobacter sp.]